MKLGYPVKAILLGIIFIGLGFLMGMKKGMLYFPNELPWLVPFFVISSILIHAMTIKAAAAKPTRFPAKFMAIQGVKLGAYMILLVGYSLYLMKEAVPFVFSFCLLYACFSALELRVILGEFNKK